MIFKKIGRVKLFLVSGTFSERALQVLIGQKLLSGRELSSAGGFSENYRSQGLVYSDFKK